jgi:NTP pyrophosphatase (non-canonical NTP hydrolase)
MDHLEAENARLVQFPALQRAIDEWQRATFPPSTAASKLAHLRKELVELEAAPTDAGEIADCIMLLVGVASLAGVDVQQALEDKLAVNKQRRWGEPDADGVVEHVR